MDQSNNIPSTQTQTLPTNDHTTTISILKLLQTIAIIFIRSIGFVFIHAFLFYIYFQIVVNYITYHVDEGLITNFITLPLTIYLVYKKVKTDKPFKLTSLPLYLPAVSLTLYLLCLRLLFSLNHLNGFVPEAGIRFITFAYHLNII